MDFASIRQFCLSFPHATEDVQWESELLFRVGGKMFAIVSFDPKGPKTLSFKCTPQKSLELIKKKNIIPAPYLARYSWVTLKRFDALDGIELRNLIQNSYQMVFQKLPRKTKRQLESTHRLGGSSAPALYL